MSIPAATKIGGGLLLAIGAPATIYATSDHIFLYSVEREVINTKNLKITVGDPDNSTKKMTISAPASSETNDPKLPENYNWSCEITIDPSSETIDTGLKGKIQKNLPKEETITDTQIKNKELLVRICAKNRITKTSNVVKGTLTLKKESNQNSYSFVDYPELDVLLKEVTASNN